MLRTRKYLLHSTSQKAVRSSLNPTLSGLFLSPPSTSWIPSASLHPFGYPLLFSFPITSTFFMAFPLPLFVRPRRGTETLLLKPYNQPYHITTATTKYYISTTHNPDKYNQPRKPNKISRQPSFGYTLPDCIETCSPWTFSAGHPPLTVCQTTTAGARAPPSVSFSFSSASLLRWLICLTHACNFLSRRPLFPPDYYY